MSKQEEIDFWPGYVDALMNLVLNLLFLSAIFAIAIFVLGMESSRLRVINSGNKEKPPQEITVVNKEPYQSNVSLMKDSYGNTEDITVPEAEKKQEDAPPIAPSPAQKVGQLAVSSTHTLVVNVAKDTDDKNDVEADSVTVKKEKDNLLAIFYPKDSVTIDESVKGELTSLFSQTFTSNQKIIVWGVSSASSAVSNRLTYLRIMAVRNVLLDSHVANKNISINIYGGKIDAAGGKIYILGAE